jgi:hypothetical protein
MIGVPGFDSRRGLGTFLFTIASRTVLGPTQPPIQWVPGALSLGVKRPRCQADHSPPCSSEVKNAWSYTSTPLYVSMAWCLVKHNFTFTLHNGYQPTGSWYLNYSSQLRRSVCCLVMCRMLKIKEYLRQKTGRQQIRQRFL